MAFFKQFDNYGLMRRRQEDGQGRQWNFCSKKNVNRFTFAERFYGIGAMVALWDIQYGAFVKRITAPVQMTDGGTAVFINQLMM